MPAGFSITGTQDGGNPSHSMPSLIASANPIFIRAQVNNTYLNIVLDTGSGTSIINHRFLKRIQHKLFRPISASFSSANRTVIHIIGEIELEIKINTLSTYITVAVATDLVTDLLLGTDWINRHVLSLDILNQNVVVRDTLGRTATTSIIQPSPSSCLSVSLTHSVTIPQYSTRSIDVQVPIRNCSNALFEPSDHFRYTEISIPDALVNIHNQHAQLPLINNTNHPLTLTKNTCIGMVSHSPTICTMASPLSDTTTSSFLQSSANPSSNLEHSCYVCHNMFLSKNDLFRHLRDKCYSPELRHQIERLTEHIEPINHQKQVQHILWKYGKLFDIRHPSKINITLENALDTEHHRPIYTPPYRRSLKDHQTLSAETAKLLDRQHIELSTSPWNSPVVLVRKKDGSTRFCVDYRKLNDITVKDSFPLPRIDDIFDQLSQSLYFTKLDFKNGYFQIPLAPKDRPKTAFSTRDNHYQFTVLPQGIKNGPPTFQRIVNQVLGPSRSRYCLAYIDDVIIFSNTFADHLSHLDDVLHSLSDANFRLSVDKCTIVTTEIDYLGHHVSHHTIRPNKENIRGLMDTSTPVTSKEIFRFVKAAEYYRRFIPNFSRIAGPLYKYAPSTNTNHHPSKTTHIALSSEDQIAFDHLKYLLTTDLVLRLPNNDLPFKIQTDASKLGVGAVLLQMYPDGAHPVCYMSKKFTPSQQRWPPIEQECYAIVAAVQHWHHYLHGQHFLIECDHKPLEAFTQKSQLNDKCERWRLKLQSYDFTVRHIKGSSNVMPDYLSRSPVTPADEDPDDIIQPQLTHAATQTESCDVTDSFQLPTVNMVTTRSHTRTNLHNDVTTSSIPPSSVSTPSSPSPNISALSQRVTTDPSIIFAGDLVELRKTQEHAPDIQRIIENIHCPRYANSYLLIDGLLMHHERDDKPVPCVPEGRFRTDIMKIYHDTPANGAHFGRDKTVEKIRTRYYWDNMISDITNYVQSCFRCKQNNPIRRKPPGHLKSIEPPTGVWQLLAMDFHGPITPVSRRGNKYIISLTDVLSKFTIAKAVRDCTADTAARFLQEDVICKYGTPKCILTDNGTHFTSHMIQKLFQRLGITHLYSTPYHPQTNGQIERFNSTMDAKIASLSNQSRSDWDDQLPFVTFNYNATRHSTTKTIPFELMYGRLPVFPSDPQHPLVSLTTDPQYSQQLNQHISNLTDITRHNITVTQQRYKSRFNANRSNPVYQINDIVLIKIIHSRRKFDTRHEGPYRIIKRLGDKTYVVQHTHMPDFVRQVTVDCIVPLSERNSPVFPSM